MEVNQLMQVMVARRTVNGVSVQKVATAIPDGICVSQLSPANRLLLNRVLVRRNEYVDHADFAKTKCMLSIFRPAGDFSILGTLPFCWNPPLPGGFKQRGRIALNANEEGRLFLQFNYARFRVSRHLIKAAGRVLTLSECRSICKWENRAIEARDAIVNGNLRLVLMMIKRLRFQDVDMHDLISDGCVTLLACIDRFDCSRGFKFSTYAGLAIRKSLCQVATRANKLRARFPFEFDTRVESNRSGESQRAEIQSTCVEELRNVLSINSAGLNDAERTVINSRFALAADTSETPEPMTLEGVGRLLGVSKERVRQIQNRALLKIRETLKESYFAA